jgi:hypothetical protein
MIFAIIGFYFFYKQGKTKFFAFFSYFILIFYICMSWSNWWYGTSYSSRAIIPAYAVLAIPLGYSLKSIFNYKVKFIVAPMILCMVALNLFQSWQTSKGILDGSRMTRAFYKSVFLQTTLLTEEQKKLLLKDKYSSQALLDINTINIHDYKLVYSQVENFDELKKEDINISDSIFVFFEQLPLFLPSQSGLEQCHRRFLSSRGRPQSCRDILQGIYPQRPL